MSSSPYEDLINNADPIDPFDTSHPNYTQYQQIFQDLQGGILKSYGRTYSLYIFIQFNTTQVNEVKEWIKSKIAYGVTSTWDQLGDTKTYKEEIERRKQLGLDPTQYYGKLCRNFFLSYSGYQVLGLNPADESYGENNNVDDVFFTEGMNKDWEGSYRLENPPPGAYWYNPPELWDINRQPKEGPGDTVHALISLAHDDLAELQDEAAVLIQECTEIGKVVACEVGYVLRGPNKGDIPVGPFGFADGISQPLFLKKDYDQYWKGQDIKEWDPKASLKLVLVKDPLGCDYSYGSYCVVEKIETNYDLFQEKVGELATAIGTDLEKASALVIGRFKDGTPLDLSDQPNQDGATPIPNSFNYGSDRPGNRCPIHAHIRKINPRRDSPEKEKERKAINRIFRTSVTYFEDSTLTNTSDPSQGYLEKIKYLEEINQQPLADNIKRISGLLFICFQRSITVQFKKLQSEWADDQTFPRSKPQYLDPLVGHYLTAQQDAEAPDPQEWSDGKTYLFYGCIKNRGGEFFFAPSIHCLKSLGQSEACVETELKSGENQ